MEPDQGTVCEPFQPITAQVTGESDDSTINAQISRSLEKSTGERQLSKEAESFESQTKESKSSINGEEEQGEKSDDKSPINSEDKDPIVSLSTNVQSDNLESIVEPAQQLFSQSETETFPKPVIVETESPSISNDYPELSLENITSKDTPAPQSEKTTSHDHSALGPISETKSEQPPTSETYSEEPSIELQPETDPIMENVDESRLNDVPDSTGTDTEPIMIKTENNRPIKRTFLYYVLSVVNIITLLISILIGYIQKPKRNQLPPITEPLLFLSASEVTKRIKSRHIKCEQIIRAYIDRIEQVQKYINAVIDSRFDDAIKDAKAIDEQLKNPDTAEALMQKPLLGVPFTCKDSIAMKGMLHTSGSWYRRNVRADEDSTVVKNMRAAGAIPLAITNVPEFVMWFETNNKLYGRARNPYDLSRITGGSSGGEGALLASAGSLLGIGSDVGGSIRIPAMFNGIFGHKTTQQYVPVDGMFPEPPEAFNDFLCFGPMCRYACDLPLMFKAMSGGASDSLNLDKPVDFKNLTIYYMLSDGGNPLTSFVDGRVVDTIHKAVDHFSSKFGTKTRLVNFTRFLYGIGFFGAHMNVTEAPEMSKIVTCGNGQLNPFKELIKSLFGLSRHTLPILHLCLLEYLPSSRDRQCEANKRYVETMLKIRKKFHELLGDNAVLFFPTWPTLAPKHNQTLLRSFDVNYTTVVNTMSVPSTHCPMGLDSYSGLPTGLQVIAGPGQDRLSLSIAAELENKFGGWAAPS